MTVEQITSGFRKISALVVGDICLDRWCTYDPATAEPSRETGIPRIGVVRTEVTPGAGGTVAANLVALGASRVAVLGVVGDDGHGHELLGSLQARGISSELMVTGLPAPTFTYTKLINAETGIEDRPRLDFISRQPLPDRIEHQVMDRLESAVAGFDLIVVSDQAETEQGVITPAVRRLLTALAVRHPQRVFWADSRQHVDEFRKVIVKPNREEADIACMRLFGQVCYQKLREHIETALMVVTLGEEGALLVEPGRVTPVETVPVEKPVDICGAGDSFSAGAALALAVTGSPAEAARFGNLAASVTIMKKGTGAASLEEVLAAAHESRDMNTLAMDIGGTKFTLAAFEGARMVRRESRSTDVEGGRDWMLAQIREIASGWLADQDFQACGIGFGGPVDYTAQRIVLSTHVGGWRNFELCAWVRSELGIPAVMDNDANVGGLGEAVHGAGAGYDPLLYMTISTGIGGGIIAGGDVYRGADSYAGEIGHLTIRPEGPECLCGARGCLERMCSGLWLQRDHGRTAKELLRDPDFVREYVADLALGLKAAIMLLNPARVVIGGGIARAGEPLFGPLREELRRQITGWSRARLDVAPAALGDDSVLWGALALARKNCDAEA